MPNWVTNNLTVTGRHKKIEKFKNTMETYKYDYRINRGYICLLDFNKIVRMPSHIFRGGLGQKEMETYKENNWYDWSYTNWGCKWNASSVELQYEDKHTLTYVFTTPWAPPIELIRILSVRFPELTFDFAYAEEFQGNLVGKATFYNGRIEHIETLQDQSDRAFEIEADIWYPQDEEPYYLEDGEYHFIQVILD